jgi:hypothetical protein
MQGIMSDVRVLWLAADANLWESAEVRFSVELSIDIRPTV